MWKDLTYGIRALRRSPVFTAAAVASLALGIGANTAIFSLIDQVVLRSLPVQDPERLVVIHGSYFGPGNSNSSWATNSESVFPYPFYRDLRDRDSAFSGLVASALAPTRFAWQGNTQHAAAQLVSGNYFVTLGVPAAVGRTIAPGDDGAQGANPVAVLSHAFWSTKLGGDVSIVNQKVAINGQPFVVIGVAQEGFNGLVQGDSADFYVPISMQRAITPVSQGIEDRTYAWLNIFGRLKPGVDAVRAQAETNVLLHAILENDLAQSATPPDSRSRAETLKKQLELRPAARGISELRNRWEKPLTVLMTMVGLVLLIACANVAGLLIARAAGRQREIAIRLALGAKRGALVKQLLVEGLLLALAGAAAGFAVEHFSTAALLQVLPREESGGWLTNTLDVRVLGFSLALSLVCALLFALAPALQSTSTRVADTLKDQAGNAPRGQKAQLRRALVTAQVALSLLLVVGAGLFSASAANLVNAYRGFRTERLEIFKVDATLIRTGQPAATAFYHDLFDRLSVLPEQTGVAASDSGPYSDTGFGTGIKVEGYQKDGAGASVKAVTPGYFAALGIPLRAGREFTDRDTGAAPKSVVVNEAFVKKYFGGANPIGRRLSFSGGEKAVLDREIVGTVADVQTDVRKKPETAIFFPYPQRDKPAGMTFYLRAAGDEGRIAAAIRRVVHEADAGLPVPEVTPVDLKIRESLYTTRLIATLSSAFGILATILAAVGLYGVISFAVARRIGEIGVRMAVGALPGDVIQLVLRDAGGMTIMGIAIGLAAAYGLSRYVESQLFGIAPANFTTYAGAAAALGVIAALAAFVPAWRASRIDPVQALRGSSQ